MFRLLKLAFYGVLGYAIYEFIRGMTQTAEAINAPEAQPSRRQQGNSGAAFSSSQTSAPRANMTGSGGGEGEKVTTAEPTGESVTHRVGRGVVAK